MVTNRWTRWDEARVKLRQLSRNDELTARLVGKAFAPILGQMVEGPPPNADVNLEHLVDTLIYFCQQHETIQGLLNGDSLDWIDDEDAFFKALNDDSFG